MLPNRAVNKSFRRVEFRPDEYDKSKLYTITAPIRLQLVPISARGQRLRPPRAQAHQSGVIVARAEKRGSTSRTEAN